MRIFDAFKFMNIDELAEWLDKCDSFDSLPWIEWFDNNYCNNCDSVYDDEAECAWCELHNKCKFFQSLDDIPDNKQLIKIWLKSEC